MNRVADQIGLERALAGLTRGTVSPAAGTTSGVRRAPGLLRLRVYLTRGALDREIAAGRPFESTHALALRARQLAQPRTRRTVARELRHVVECADRVDSRSRLSAVVIEPHRVRAGRGALLRLAEALEQPMPLSPRGIALARVLLTDGRSPLFNRLSEQTVSEAVCGVEDALVMGQLAPSSSS